MITRKVKTGLIAVSALGIVVASVLFVVPMLDPGDREPSRTTISLADLETGSFVEVELQSSHVFVLRDFDEQVYVFSVPYSEAAYWLPEFDWSHPAIPCAQFEPDNKNGMLVEDGKFRCVLPDHGEFFRREHSWSYSGENQGYRTADMKIADHEITESAVLLPRSVER